MPSKIEVTALVVLLVAGFWWWTARDTPGELPEAEQATATRPAMRAPQDDAQTQHSPEKPSGTSRIESANVPEPGVLAPEVARTNAAGEEIAAPLEGQESSRTRRRERRGLSERERERSGGGEKEPGHGETGQDRRLLGLPLTLPGKAPELGPSNEFPPLPQR